MNIEILRANIADSAGIARVQITSYRSAYAPFFPKAYIDHFTMAEQTQDWRDLLNDPQHEPMFVAKNDAGEIVGYALGKTQPNALEPMVGEVDALHVLPECQRQGIGSALFATMARELKQRGKTELMLWTLEGNPVRAFYDRLNGDLVGQKSYEVDEVAVTEVAYRWRDIDTLIQSLARTNGA